MTKFKTGSTVSREIRVFGVPSPVQMQATVDGLSFWIKGTKKRLTLNWAQAVRAAVTPMDVPSFLAGKPLEFLQHEAKQVEKRTAKREAKQSRGAQAAKELAPTGVGR